jgi:Uma2 family endonuclease
MLKTKRSSRPSEPSLEDVGFPPQGAWTEEDFFALDRQSNRLKELVEGYLEILPIPIPYHQDVLIFLFDLLRDYLKSVDDKGRFYLAPCPVRFSTRLIREPDIFYVNEQQLMLLDSYFTEVDFIMEIVSGGREDRKRDLVTKPKDYAKAGVKEYWIVDPKTSTIHVLTLNKATKRYRRHGKFTLGQTATSKMFKGFSVAVSEVFKKR